MKKTMILGLIMALTVGVYACGGGDNTNTNTDTVTLTTIDQLPRATDPVVDAATGSISASTIIGAAKDATTGIKLGDLSANSFTEDSSMAMCEISNILKDSINSAAQADLILCYIQNTMPQVPSVDIYDGNFHYFTVDEQGQMGPDHVKLRLVKDADGNITDFVMFACANGEQQEYLHQTIDGTTVAIVGRGVYVEAEGSGSHQIDVSGTLNEDGNYTAKTITTHNMWGNGDNVGWGTMTMIQGDTTFTINGYQKGTYAEGDESGSFENRAYTVGQLIDHNTSTTAAGYDIGLLAIGDGGLYGELLSSYSYEGQDGIWTANPEVGWDGDTTLEYDSSTASATIGAYITNAVSHSADLATVQTQEQETYAFTSDSPYYYDCSGTVEASVTPPATLDTVECANLTLGYQWVNCWQIIEQGGGN